MNHHNTIIELRKRIQELELKCRNLEEKNKRLENYLYSSDNDTNYDSDDNWFDYINVAMNYMS